MFNQNNLKLYKNELSVDHFNCGKGEEFKKDELMKIQIQTDKGGHSHIYHSYNVSEYIIPSCDLLTIDNYDSVINAFKDQGSFEENQYVESQQECEDLCIDTPLC